MGMDIKTALDIITGFLDGYVYELEEDERKLVEKAETALYKYVEGKETPHRAKHDADQLIHLFPMTYYPCPYCGKTLDNQKIYGLCDNEREFYCDDCNKTYVIEEDAVYEEPNDQWSGNTAIRICEKDKK
jgi:hypothetical protein